MKGNKDIGFAGMMILLVGAILSVQAWQSGNMLYAIVYVSIAVILASSIGKN